MRILVLVLVLASAAASAQSIRPGSSGVNATSVANAGAVMKSGGGTTATMTQALTFSGVTTDITTVSAEDLTVVGAGTGSVVIQSGDNFTQVLDSVGNVDVTIGASGNSSAAGGNIQINDSRTTLASSACDTAGESGTVVWYQDGNVVSFCACVQTAAATFAWEAMHASADCTGTLADEVAASGLVDGAHAFAAGKAREAASWFREWTGALLLLLGIVSFIIRRLGGFPCAV